MEQTLKLLPGLRIFVATPSRQIAGGPDLSSLITVIWITFYALVFYWFYRILQRIEKTLVEIKKQLESRSSAAT